MEANTQARNQRKVKRLKLKPAAKKNLNAKSRSAQSKKLAGKQPKKSRAVTRQQSGRAKQYLPTEKPDTMEAAKHHQAEYDTDIEDPRAYRERQESYMTEEMLEDPGTFEN